MEKDRSGELLHSAAAAGIWDKIDKKGAARAMRKRLSRRRSRRWVYISSAAAVVVAAVITFFMLTHDRQAESPFAMREGTTVWQTPDQQVLISIAGSREYRIDNDVTAVDFENGAGSLRREGSDLIISFAEDVLLPGGDTALVTLAIPRGEQYRFTMEDGTVVWLNSETTISFPARFASGERVVEFEGEACFEVARDPERPFMVKSGGLRWEVLGTVFNISAYPGCGFVTTTLLEGSIRKELKTGGESFVLVPNQQLRYEKTTHHVDVSNVPTGDVVAWRDGVMVYRDMPLAQILTSLGRAYNYEINIRCGDLKDDRFHVIVNKQEHISIALDVLKTIGGFAYEINDNHVTVY